MPESNGAACGAAEKVKPAASPASEEPAAIAGNISFHAQYSPHFSPLAFGPEQAASLMERLSKSLKTQAFEFIRKADYKSLQMALASEHPQTIALVLSYARSEQAAQVIVELPREKQIDVVERIANLDSVSPEMIAIVEETLGKRFANIASAEQVEVGGVTYVADIVNRVDRATEKYIFNMR